MSGTRGRLIIESIPNDNVRKALVGFLAGITRNVPVDKIAQAIANPPTAIVINLPLEKRLILMGRLEELGAKVNFASIPEAAPQTLGEETPEGKTPRSSHEPQCSRTRNRKGILTAALLLMACAIGAWTAAGFLGSSTPSDRYLPLPQTYQLNGVRYTLMDEFEKWSSTLFVEKNFDAVEQKGSLLLNEADDSAKMYDLYLLYATLSSIRDARNIEPMKRVLSEWCLKKPESHVAWLVRGVFCINLAWHIRGSAPAKDVPEQVWAKFRETLHLAREYLDRSWQLNSGDPNAPCFLITVANALSYPRNEMEHYYQTAISVCPLHFGARYQKLDYLKPKWHGSPEEMFEFAIDCLESSHQDPFLGLIMANALEDAHKHGGKDENLLGKGEVWTLIVRIYDNYFKRYPNHVRRRFFYAYQAFKGRQYDIAYEQFEVIGDRWIKDTNWESLDQFNRSRAFTLYKKGEEMLWKRNEPAASTHYFTQSIKCNPTADAYYALGLSYWRTESPGKEAFLMKEAEKALLKALELKPDHPHAEEQLGALRTMMKQVPK